MSARPPSRSTCVRALLGLLVMSLGSGCATFGFGPKLRYDARVYLLDAEEDLMTARARAEEASRAIQRATSAVAEAQTRSERLPESSSLKADATASVAVAKAQLSRAQRAQELLAASMTCAEIRYQAARARAEVRFKIEGANESHADRLSERAASCETALAPKEEALAEATETLERKKAERERASVAAAASSPVENPRPWIE